MASHQTPGEILRRKKHLAAMRRWYRKNRAQCIAYAKRYQKKNRKKKTAYSKLWRLKNHARCLSVEMAYRKKNRKRINAYITKWHRKKGVIPIGEAREKYRFQLAHWAKKNGYEYCKIWTPERRQKISTAVSKRMSLQPAQTAFSNAKQGFRDDLGIYCRSSWEANYARFLNFLIKHEGKIDRWEYEPETFWFEAIRRGVRSYKPDFKVFFRNGSIEYHEVKGWMYPRAKTALARMAKYHPAVTIVLIDEARYKGIASSVRRIIRGWE